MAQELAPAANKKMIRGTEGNENYLLIGQREGIDIGIRPLVKVLPHDLAIHFRLRACRSVEGSEIKVDEAVKAFFPRIKFSKMHADRCSVIVGMGHSMMFYVSEDLIKSMFEMLIKPQIEQIFQYMHGVEWELLPEQVIDYMYDATMEAYEKCKVLMEEHPNEWIDTSSPALPTDGLMGMMKKLMGIKEKADEPDTPVETVH